MDDMQEKQSRGFDPTEWSKIGTQVQQPTSETLGYENVGATEEDIRKSKIGETIKEPEARIKEEIADIRLQVNQGEEEQDNVPDEEKVKTAYRTSEYGMEIASKTTPAEVLHSTRMFTARMAEFWYQYELQPPTYFTDNQLLPTISDRKNKLLIDIPLGYGEKTPEDIEAGLIGGVNFVPATDEDVLRAARNGGGDRIEKVGNRYYVRIETDENEAYKQSETLAEQLDKSIREVKAIETILQKLQEQDVYAGDVELYMVNAFKRLGKLRMDTKHYAEGLNLEPSHEGFRPLGEKTEEAFSDLRRIAAGEAIVNVNGEPMTLPNVFALPRNQGMMDFVIKKYIVPRLGYTTPNTNEHSTPKQKALRNKEELDNIRAAHVALAYFRHWDLDSYFSFGINPKAKENRGNVRSPRNLTRRDLENLDLATSFADNSKAVHFEVRRASEWGRNFATGEGRRDHPRVAGPPSTLGCYPSLTSHALDLMNTEVQAHVKGRPTDTKVISMSIEQRVFGSGEVKRDGVTYEYDTVSLGDRSMWDNATILEGGQAKLADDPDLNITPVDTSEWNRDQIDRAAQRVITFALGASTNEFEIPNRLQGYYAYQFMFAQFMRTDYQKLKADVLDGELLVKMSKGIDIGLGMLASGLEIDGDAAKKLNQYMRVVFLGGLAASIIKPVGKDSVEVGEKMENKAQISGRNADTKEVMSAIQSAGLTTGFLDGREELGSSMKWSSDRQKDLYEYIVNHRKAPTPYELKEVGLAGWFTDEELKAILPLYPLENR